MPKKEMRTIVKKKVVRRKSKSFKNDLEAMVEKKEEPTSPKRIGLIGYGKE